jgi:hypothetical protein
MSVSSIEEAKRRKQTSARVAIKVSTDEHVVTSQAVTALARNPDIYQRSGTLVHVVTDSRSKSAVSRPPGSPYIAELQLPRLRELLSEQVDFQRWNERKGEWSASHVPDWVVREVGARQQWSEIRHLEAVSATPMLRPDGSIIDEPGLDEATGVLFLPRRDFPRVPPQPTRDDAQAAVQVLCDILSDFPFATAEHRSGALAGLLTPLARHAFAGPSPLILIDKNTHGAGGSLLADTIATAATGHGMARMSQAKDDDEERKRILSIALAGDATVLIDNIDRPLGGAALDSALTGTEWRDRILGRSEMATAPLLACWFATGNNVAVQRDTLRRTLPIRLETPEERPEERQGFKYTPLLPHVEREHPRLVAAALTLLRAYSLAGKPSPDVKPWGSFEGWSDLVRGALVWVGQADPALARQHLVAGADSEAAALRVLLENWDRIDTTGTGVTAARMLESIASSEPHSGDDVTEALREALAEIAPPGAGGKPASPKGLGKRLMHLKGRVVGGAALDCRAGNLGQVWFKRRTTHAR